MIHSTQHSSSSSSQPWQRSIAVSDLAAAAASEMAIPTNQVIPRCPFIPKNSHYVHLLNELRAKNTPPTIDGLIIPVLDSHPHLVQSGMIYFFTGDGTDHKTWRGTFDQNGRPTKLYDSANEKDRAITGYKRTYVLKNHNRGENFRFGKWLFCLENFDTMLIHYYSKTHPHEFVKFRDSEGLKVESLQLSRHDLKQENSSNGLVSLPSMELNFVINNELGHPVLPPPSFLENPGKRKINANFEPSNNKLMKVNQINNQPNIIPNNTLQLQYRPLGIRGISPNKGPPLRENGIKIFGEGFSPTSVVYWNRRPSETAFISNNELWSFVPASPTNSLHPVAELFVQDYHQRSNSASFLFTEETSKSDAIGFMREKLSQIETHIRMVDRYSDPNDLLSIKRQFEQISSSYREMKEDLSKLGELEPRFHSLQVVLSSFEIHDKLN